MAGVSPSIDVSVARDGSGEITSARVRFGPHFAAEVREERGTVTFRLVYTHHGFEVDASEVSGELEQLIDEIRVAHPDTCVD